MTIGELLSQKYELHERKDSLNMDLSGVNRALAEVDAALMAALKDSGQTKASDDRVTVSITDKVRAKYDPEKWPAIMESLVKAGYGHVVQRRLTDAKVIEMIENGVELPDGLTVESYPDLSFRRTNATAK